MIKKDEHITVTPEVFEKLKELCSGTLRSKRAEVSKLIEDEHKKVFKKEKINV